MRKPVDEVGDWQVIEARCTAGVQGGTCARGDQGVAVHHPHEAHLPH